MSKIKSRKRRIIAWSILGGILAFILIFAAVYGICWAVRSKSPAEPYGEYVLLRLAKNLKRTALGRTSRKRVFSICFRRFA